MRDYFVLGLLAFLACSGCSTSNDSDPRIVTTNPPGQKATPIVAPTPSGTVLGPKHLHIADTQSEVQKK